MKVKIDFFFAKIEMDRKIDAIQYLDGVKQIKNSEKSIEISINFLTVKKGLKSNTKACYLFLSIFVISLEQWFSTGVPRKALGVPRKAPGVPPIYELDVYLLVNCS